MNYQTLIPDLNDFAHFFTGDLLLSNPLQWQQGTLHFHVLNFRISLIHNWKK